MREKEEKHLRRKRCDDGLGGEGREVGNKRMEEDGGKGVRGVSDESGGVGCRMEDGSGDGGGGGGGGVRA